MMEVYKVTTELFFEGQRMRTEVSEQLFDTPPTPNIIPINWDNIDEVCNEHYDVVRYYELKQKKKGRKIFFPALGVIFKEWKTPELKDCYILVTCVKARNGVTLKDLFDMDAEKAIQYIKERIS